MADQVDWDKIPLSNPDELEGRGPATGVAFDVGPSVDGLTRTPQSTVSVQDLPMTLKRPGSEGLYGAPKANFAREFDGQMWEPAGTAMPGDDVAPDGMIVRDGVIWRPSQMQKAAAQEVAAPQAAMTAYGQPVGPAQQAMGAIKGVAKRLLGEPEAPVGGENAAASHVRGVNPFRQQEPQRRENDMVPAGQPSARTNARVGGATGLMSAEMEMRKAADAEKKAIQEAAIAGKARAAEEFTAMEAFKSAQQQQAVREAEVRAQSKRALEEQERLYQQDLASLRNINSEVDPGKYWADRNVGSKILAGIGMILGGFDPSGQNRAVELVQRAIDRDIDAQKANIQTRIAKGREAISSRQNLMGMMRQRFGDDLSAELAARQVMNEQFKTQLEQVARVHAGDEKAEAAAQAMARIDQSIAANAAQLRERQQELSMRREALELDKIKTFAGIRAAEAESMGKPVPADQAAKVGKLDAASQLVDEFTKDLESKDRDIISAARIWDKAKAAIDGTDEANQARSSRMIAEGIMKALKGEALQEADVQRAMQYIPMPGDAGNTVKAKKAAFKSWIEQERKGLLGGLKASGYNTREFDRGNTADPTTKFR